MWSIFGPSGRQTRDTGKRARFCPRIEVLEGRCLPSTLTVLNTADSGPGSLRAEIAAAQSGDTIVIDPSLAGRTINLTGGELAIKQSLTIQGTAGNPEQISGSFASRVFDITGSANVTLDNLVIEDGMSGKFLMAPRAMWPRWMAAPLTTRGP
jgi:hypothetical protein